jgi:hypothetical protein
VVFGTGGPSPLQPDDDRVAQHCDDVRARVSDSNRAL